MLTSCDNGLMGHSREMKNTSFQNDSQKSDIAIYKPKAGFGSIEILKIKNCEYILWVYHTSCDMEHFEGCDNPKHQKN